MEDIYGEYRCSKCGNCSELCNCEDEEIEEQDKLRILESRIDSAIEDIDIQIKASTIR